MPSPPGNETVDSSEIPLNNPVEEAVKNPEIEAGTSADQDYLDVLRDTNPTKASTSIITSATKLLKEGEHQWLNCEVQKLFLSKICYFYF